MTAGIVGLGLIGGSFAKAYSEAGHEVLAFDTDRSMFDFAKMSGAVSDELTNDNISRCDVVLICTYPGAAIDTMRRMGPYIGQKPVIIDCCGTKREVCEAGFRIAEDSGFTYVGGHPMAGTQFSGFKYARAYLFNGAPMVLVPAVRDDIVFFSKLKELLSPAGFGSYAVTTAEQHDEVIAFTSQLAHIVSSAYIKSPTASVHKGFSAGSYRDMTRVAWLNPGMWTELFLDNGENLIKELDILIENLREYRDAIAGGDSGRLYALLDEGRKRKEEVDGN